MERRQFLMLSLAAGGGLMFAPGLSRGGEAAPALISPGCRGTKVKVGRIYLSNPTSGHWPHPKLDSKAEIQSYEREFARLAKPLGDVEFIGNMLAESPEQAREAAGQFTDVDGILIIHVEMGVMPSVAELLKAGKPTVMFAQPYSGHEWTGFGKLAKETPLFDSLLTSDMDQLAAAIRPIRAIHHMREAKIINITMRKPSEEYLAQLREKFGTQIEIIGREPTLEAFESIPEKEARAEAKRWTEGATAVVEPNEDEIYRSSRLALAFQKILDERGGTALTVDCYGTMYQKLPAFPCIGLTRLEDTGLGGVCESDLRMAVTMVMMQGLTGRPGFVSDPTVDESKKAIILAHCRCATKMDGPEGEAAPYKLRTIMERQEGCVAQVSLPLERRVTQAILVDPNALRYFTGKVIEAPDVERACRTKITVQVDGSIERLWRNWDKGLHRLTVYADALSDLTRFCKFKGIAMTDEAA